VNRIRIRSLLTRRLTVPAPVKASTVTGPIRLVIIRKRPTAAVLVGLVALVPVGLLAAGLVLL
jgi:hypothetical protein